MDQDPKIRRAEEMRDRALAEARRWDDFLRMYAELGELDASPDSAAARGKAVVSPIRRAVRTVESDKAAANLVQQRGPMHTRPLLLEMQKAGFQIGGKNPHATLHTRLSRGALLAFDPDRGWRLKGEGVIAPPVAAVDDEKAGLLEEGVEPSALADGATASVA